MCRDKVDDDVIRNVERIIELVMIRDNMLQLSSNVFSLMDIRDIMIIFNSPINGRQYKKTTQKKR